MLEFGNLIGRSWWYIFVCINLYLLMNKEMLSLLHYIATISTESRTFWESWQLNVDFHCQLHRLFIISWRERTSKHPVTPPPPDITWERERSSYRPPVVMSNQREDNARVLLPYNVGRELEQVVVVRVWSVELVCSLSWWMDHLRRLYVRS